MHAYIHTKTYRRNARRHTHTHTQTHVHVHTHRHTYMYTHAHTQTHVHVHTRARTVYCLLKHSIHVTTSHPSRGAPYLTVAEIFMGLQAKMRRAAKKKPTRKTGSMLHGLARHVFSWAAGAVQLAGVSIQLQL